MYKFSDKRFIAHYTDLSAATSILLNRKIWLTEIRYLNDTEEFFEGANKILERLKITNIEKNDARIKKIIDIFSEFSNGEFGDKLIFTCSFSKSLDTLSQWRAYGLYAIEFYDSALDSFDCSNYECIYDDWGPYNHVNKIVDNIWTEVNTLTPEDIDHTSELINILIRGSLIFKNRGFNEENEHRAFKILNIRDANIKYRIKDNTFIPYIEIDIPKNIELRVRVGPLNDQEMAVQALGIFLKNKNLEHVEQDVQYSSIPYRW